MSARCPECGADGDVVDHLETVTHDDVAALPFVDDVGRDASAAVSIARRGRAHIGR